MQIAESSESDQGYGNKEKEPKLEIIKGPSTGPKK